MNQQPLPQMVVEELKEGLHGFEDGDTIWIEISGKFYRAIAVCNGDDNEVVIQVDDSQSF